MNVSRTRTALVVALTLTTMLSQATIAAADDPTDVGAKTYRDYIASGQMIATEDPRYAVLDAIGAPIARAAASVSAADTPHFFLIRDPNPNAYSVPGGNVYVSDSLLAFVENREELAGILCHETAHLLDHDSAKLDAATVRSERAAGLVGGLFRVNRSVLGPSAEAGVANLATARYSRSIEASADALGANLCARAGSNPWGLVWLLEKFERSSGGPEVEILSDHPSEVRRVELLEDVFRDDPKLYAPFRIGVASGTPL